MEYSELCLHEVFVVNPQQWIVPVAHGSALLQVQSTRLRIGILSVSESNLSIMLTPESDDLSGDSLELNEKWKWHQAANMVVTYNTYILI